MTQINKTNHLSGIDSLRGLAAVSVFCFHMLSITMPETSMFKPWFFLFSGHEAVVLFFVLSGYILTFANSTGYTYKQYVIRRIFRIYPAYYFTMLLGVTLFLLIKPMPLSQYSHWFNTQFSNIELNFRTWVNISFLITNHQSRINGVIWSLVYEVLISVFILPLLWKVKTKKSIILVGILYALFFVMRQLIHVHIHILDEAIYFSVFFYMGYLMFLFQEKLTILSKTWLIPVYIFCYSSIYFSFNFIIFQKATIRDLLTGFGSMGFLYLVIYNPYVQKVLSNKIINFYGKISYSFYLLHICIMYGVVYTFKDYLSLNILITMTFIITTIISAISYYWIEKPFIKFSRKIT